MSDPISQRHPVRQFFRFLFGGLTILAGIGLLISALYRLVRLPLANAPALWFSGETRLDQVFDAETGLAMDIYMPRQVRRHPVVVFFHGGSWQTGRRQDFRFIGETLARRGFAVAIPDYRKHPDVRFPAFVEDAAQAIAYLRREANGLGLDRDRVAVMGHSAGAHIGALLAADGRYLATAGTGPLAGFIGLAGPYHFTPEEPVYQEIFGPPERYAQMQATTFVDGSEPAMLLQYGLNDSTVGPQNLDQFVPALEAAGSCVRQRRYPGVDHISIIAAFTWLYRRNSAVFADTIAFLDQLFDGVSCPVLAERE